MTEDFSPKALLVVERFFTYGSNCQFSIDEFQTKIVLKKFFNPIEMTF